MKYRKQQRGKRRGVSFRGSKIVFGQFALKSIENGWVTARQIEASRRAMTRFIKRGGEIWIRIFPDKPITKSSAETPMGSGKGSLDHFVAIVKPGRVLFEMSGVSKKSAHEALRLAQHKLPLKTIFVEKEEL